MTPISYATHLNEAVVADDNFLEDKISFGVALCHPCQAIQCKRTPTTEAQGDDQGSCASLSEDMASAVVLCFILLMFWPVMCGVGE